MREAMLYEKLNNGMVRCNLCAHRCKIQAGKLGLCAVRENREGRLHTLVYGQSISAAIDPIEKKPLYHFLPGSQAFSIATAGCNFNCSFCQNADISQLAREGSQDWKRHSRDLPPEAVVSLAASYNCATIAYTYTEPTIFFEYAYDTARLASRQGIKNIFVTNGFMTPELLDTIGSDLHAANVDLKAFTNRFYKKLCGGRLQPVLDSIVKMHQLGVWVEVTTLLIPGENDDEQELGEIAGWLAALDPNIPWHISRFHPAFKMRSHPPTPVSSIHRAVEIGRAAGLNYIYTGNVPGDVYQHTVCPTCKAVTIERSGYHVRNKLVDGNICPQCGAALTIIAG